MSQRASSTIPGHLTNTHLNLRQAKLDELDADLQRIFEGVPIDQIFDVHLDEALKLQELRFLRHQAKLRRVDRL